MKVEKEKEEKKIMIEIWANIVVTSRQRVSALTARLSLVPIFCIVYLVLSGTHHPVSHLVNPVLNSLDSLQAVLNY